MPFLSKPLDWDTAFFGFAVAELSGYGDGLSFVQEIEKAKGSGIKLIYWRWSGPVMPEFALPPDLKIFNCGMKWRLEKKPQLQTDKIMPVVHNLTGVVNKEMKQLAISAGEFSRFRTDPNMPKGSFYKMYEQWIQNSVSGEMADKVFVAEAENTIMGLITVKKTDRMATIGLFSVDEKYRNKGLGLALLICAEHYAAESGCEKIIVATQEQSPAARLYQKNEFMITVRENIMHIWL